MSQQTKVVTKVRENIRSYPNKMDQGKLMYIHGITIEGDPQEWEYHSKEQECKKFFPNQEATFTTEVKVNGQFTNYKIAPFSAKPAFGGGGGFKKSDRDQEAITALSAASSSATFYSQRQGSHQDVLDLAEKIYNFAMSKSKK